MWFCFNNFVDKISSTLPLVQVKIDATQGILVAKTRLFGSASEKNAVAFQKQKANKLAWQVSTAHPKATGFKCENAVRLLRHTTYGWIGTRVLL